MRSTKAPKKSLGTTWFTRAKLVVAGAVLAGTAVFGTAVISAPDAQPVDEQAWGATWSYTSHTGGGGGTQSFGATWS